jgi:hypothetical protein
MVSTVKFSQFANAGNIDNDQTTVGVNAGANVQYNNPWTFLPPGPDGSRPTPSPSIYNKLRFNTTSFLYEYYDQGSMMWVQLSLVPTGTDVTKQEVQQSAFNYQPSVGTNDAFVVNLNPAVTTLTDGLLVSMNSESLHNLTPTPTLQINALTPVDIVTYWGNLSPGDIAPHGTYLFIYDASSNTFELINPTISTANTTFVQYNTYNTATDSGIVNAYAGTLTPAITVLNNSIDAYIIIAHNNTGPSTLTLNGLTRDIVTSGGNALVGGELVIGQNAYFVYSGTFDAFILMNPVNTMVSALQWATISGTTQNAVVGTGYIPLNVALTTITLPVSCAIGDQVAVQGSGSGGWLLQAAGGQTIQFGASATTSGGSLASTQQQDAVTVVCISNNTTWAVRGAVGNLTIA